MREMNSADLTISDLRALERLLPAGDVCDELAKTVRAAASTFPSWDATRVASARKEAAQRRGKPTYQVVRSSDAFEESLAALYDGLGATLEQLFPAAGDPPGNGRQPGAPDGKVIETYLAVQDLSLKIQAFLGALQRGKSGYVTFLSRVENGGRRLKIFCVNPSHDLGERLEQAKAAIFFSGTLLPMDYHRKLLAAQDDDMSLDVPSSFDHDHLQVLIGSDVSARFSQRGPELYARVAAYLATLTRTYPGNYLCFLPSYAMLEEVAQALDPLAETRMTVIRQHPRMREGERELFVGRFHKPHDEGTSLVGLCVLGGVFGESIDLPGETLVGVIVVGTGMPRASAEREVIRDYFDAKANEGFAYAYTYPGLNKVLQAAGRLIRTEEDRGVVLLLDDRFLERELRRAFPKEWKRVRDCTLQTMPSLLSRS